jgi:tetratricopeptide (TPR) repeat protein
VTSKSLGPEASGHAPGSLGDYLSPRSSFWGPLQLHCPEDAELLLLHGVLLREAGDAVNAETCLLRLLEGEVGEEPASRRRRLAARRELALLQGGLDRLAEAVGHWRAVLAEEPKDRAALLGLAGCLLAQERWGEVEGLLRRLEKEEPKAVEALLLRGWLHLGRRQFEEARQMLDEAAATAPRSVEARVLLSYVHLQEDRDPAAAEAALQAVLELDAGNREARRNLAVLRRKLAAAQA